MRTKLAIVFVALLVVPVAGAATGIRATLKAPAANPEIMVKWWYSIKVTNLQGKPVNARLTAHVIDPFGGIHPMGYGPTEPPVPIKNRLIRGGFRDFLEFPPESRGFKLTLRWIVKAKIGAKTYTKVLKRLVTPG